MTWPSSITVDAVFIPVYIVLGLLSLFNVIHHGAGKTFGFIYLLIFSLVRLISNALLVYSYKTHYKNANIAEWGFILQGLGYSFLISATLAFFNRANDKEDSRPNLANDLPGIHNFVPSSTNDAASPSIKQTTIGRIFHLVNIAALLLLIFGYTDSNLFSSAGASIGDGELDIKAKIGDVIFLFLSIAIAILSLLKLRSTVARSESRFLLSFILVALVPMSIRMVYVTIRSFSRNPFDGSLVLKVIFEFVMEVLAVIVYGSMGIFLRRFVVRSLTADTEAANDMYQKPS